MFKPIIEERNLMDVSDKVHCIHKRNGLRTHAQAWLFVGIQPIMEARVFQPIVMQVRACLRVEMREI